MVKEERTVVKEKQEERKVFGWLVALIGTPLGMILFSTIETVAFTSSLSLVHMMKINIFLLVVASLSLCV